MKLEIQSYISALFLPQGVEIERIFTLYTVVSEVGLIFKISIFG